MQLIAFGQAARAPAPAGVRVFAVAADRQRLAVEQRQQGRLVAVAQALFQSAPEDAGSDAIDAAAHRPFRRDQAGAQPRRAPMGRLASPAHRAIVQRGPEQDGDNDPGLELHVLLSDLLRGLLQVVIQYRPEFAFHGTAPFLVSLQEKAAENVPETRTPFI